MRSTLCALVMLALVLLPAAGCSSSALRSQYDRMTGSQPQSRVDINSASVGELERLPGLSSDDANRIVQNRPYSDTDALVRRGILGPKTYDKIEDYVYTSRSRSERANQGLDQQGR